MSTPRSGQLVSSAPLAPEADHRSSPTRSFTCDQCGEEFEGQPQGKGLFMWTRGDEVRYEEPPLCPECADQTYAGAVFAWLRDFE